MLGTCLRLSRPLLCTSGGYHRLICIISRTVAVRDQISARRWSMSRKVGLESEFCAQQTMTDG
jgi:hypothetical protein